MLTRVAFCCSHSQVCLVEQVWSAAVAPDSSRSAARRCCRECVLRSQQGLLRSNTLSNNLQQAACCDIHIFIFIFWFSSSLTRALEVDVSALLRRYARARGAAAAATRWCGVMLLMIMMMTTTITQIITMTDAAPPLFPSNPCPRPPCRPFLVRPPLQERRRPRARIAGRCCAAAAAAATAGVARARSFPRTSKLMTLNACI